MTRQDTETERRWNADLEIHDRIWLCARWYERHDGMEHVERVCTHEDGLDDYRRHGYTITEYRIADSQELDPDQIDNLARINYQRDYPGFLWDTHNPTDAVKERYRKTATG